MTKHLLYNLRLIAKCMRCSFRVSQCMSRHVSNKISNPILNYFEVSAKLADASPHYEVCTIYASVKSVIIGSVIGPQSEPVLSYCLIEIPIFSFIKLRLKLSSATYRSFHLGFSELIHHWSWNVVGIKPLPEPMLIYNQLDLQEQTSAKFTSKQKSVLLGKCHLNCLCKILAISLIQIHKQRCYV